LPDCTNEPHATRPETFVRVAPNVLAPSECFRRRFTKSNLRLIYKERIELRGPTGLDRISPERFASQSSDQIDVAYRKIRDGTYAFTPYAETLLLRGKDMTCPPIVGPV